MSDFYQEANALAQCELSQETRRILIVALRSMEYELQRDLERNFPAELKAVYADRAEKCRQLYERLFEVTEQSLTEQEVRERLAAEPRAAFGEVW